LSMGGFNHSCSVRIKRIIRLEKYAYFNVANDMASLV